MKDYQSPIPNYDEWEDQEEWLHTASMAYNAAKRVGDEALEEQQTEIQRLSETLEFYFFSSDDGSRARAALAEKP